MKTVSLIATIVLSLAIHSFAIPLISDSSHYAASGTKDGAWESYYENGKVQTKGAYRKGKLEGVYETYKDVVDDMIEVVDSVTSLKNTATAIVENSIQVYQKVSGQIKENGEDKSDSSDFDSSSATREVFGSENDNLSEIQDVRSLDLPKP